MMLIMIFEIILKFGLSELFKEENNFYKKDRLSGLFILKSSSYRRGFVFPSIVLLNFRQVHQAQLFMSKLVICNMP